MKGKGALPHAHLGIEQVCDEALPAAFSLTLKPPALRITPK